MIKYKKDNSSYRDDSRRPVKFINHLESIKATLYDYQTMEQLEKWVPEFTALTWLEDTSQIEGFLKERKMTRNDIVMEAFAFRTLPTVLENIRFTFLLEGISMTGVTHIIRHRLFSFSAQSTDPVQASNHPILESEAFLQDPELLEKSRKLCEDAHDLYNLALDKGVSYYDARAYMPRAKENKYFMSGSIKDFIAFYIQRAGQQNQPTEDRILALRIRQAILEVYPFLESRFPTKIIEYHYLGAITHKMNLNTWPPLEHHKEILKERGIDISKIEFDHTTPKQDMEVVKVSRLIEDAIIANEI